MVTELKAAGSTILMATHEIGFARPVAERAVFPEGGLVVEEGRPAQALDVARSDREFLSRVMR